MSFDGTVPMEAAPLMDLERIRRDFPQLSRQENGRLVVYLDSAATSQKPRAVIDAVTRVYEQQNANVHRGLYLLSQEATEAYEGARDRVARFTGAEDRRGVIFTSNCTAAINLAAYAWGRRNLRPGDEILLTVQEHHSNLVPWQLCARDTGATLRHLPLEPGGAPDLSRLETFIGQRTRLVAASGMSNVLGQANTLAPIIEAAHGQGARVLVDGAQLAMHAPVDVRTMGADFFAFSGHKVLGPTGVGALVVRPELLQEMAPFLSGGEMVLRVSLEDATFAEAPHKFEAGTPMIAQAVGLGAALEYLEELGPELVADRDARLVESGLDLLGQVEGLTLYGPGAGPGRAPTFSFNLFGRSGRLIHPHDVGTMLAQEGIAIRAGHHCAQPLMEHFGVPAMCRASALFYNSAAELEQLAAALERVARFFDR